MSSWVAAAAAAVAGLAFLDPCVEASTEAPLVEDGERLASGVGGGFLAEYGHRSGTGPVHKYHAQLAGIASEASSSNPSSLADGTPDTTERRLSEKEAEPENHKTADQEKKEEKEDDNVDTKTETEEENKQDETETAEEEEEETEEEKEEEEKEEEEDNVGKKTNTKEENKPKKTETAEDAKKEEGKKEEGKKEKEEEEKDASQPVVIDDNHGNEDPAGTGDTGGNSAPSAQAQAETSGASGTGGNSDPTARTPAAPTPAGPTPAGPEAPTPAGLTPEAPPPAKNKDGMSPWAVTGIIIAAVLVVVGIIGGVYSAKTRAQVDAPNTGAANVEMSQPAWPHSTAA